MFGDFSARLQTLTTSKASTELLAVFFLAIEGDWINRRWKCKKAKRLCIAANSFTNIDQTDGYSAQSRNQSAHELRKKKHQSSILREINYVVSLNRWV